MKHPRKIIKAQTANAVLLSLFTAFSPSQVFGSSFASTDANEYLFKEYVPNHKRIHSAPIEHVLRKELEDFSPKLLTKKEIIIANKMDGEEAKENLKKFKGKEKKKKKKKKKKI